MPTFYFFLLLVSLSTTVMGKEKILLCKMNYGISGENDETDIEFKNLSIVDQDQVLYLDIKNKWLSIESKKEDEQSQIQYSKQDFLISDSTIFSVSVLEKEGNLLRKNTIELNRYSGFVKHEFRTSAETIYRTGRCIHFQKQKLF